MSHTMMNDPHVEKLFYVVEKDDWIDYSSAEGLFREEDGFRLQVEDKMVCFEMKEHYPTVEAALEVIDRYVRNWELDTGLKEEPGRFRLRFQRSKVKDRNPLPLPPGSRVGYGTPIIAIATLGEATGTTPPRPFPLPSEGLNLDASDPDVDTMYHRYEGYILRRESLPSMAYFCLTVLESLASDKPYRQKAASEYSISSKVLKKIANLTGNKGGRETARKAQGIDSELTSQESLFLEKAIKAIIRRAAEAAANRNGSFQEITLADLPSC